MTIDEFCDYMYGVADNELHPHDSELLTGMGKCPDDQSTAFCTNGTVDLSNFDSTPDETLYGLSPQDFFARCAFPFMKSSPIKIRPAAGAVQLITASHRLL